MRKVEAPNDQLVLNPVKLGHGFKRDRGGLCTVHYPWYFSHKFSRKCQGLELVLAFDSVAPFIASAFSTKLVSKLERNTPHGISTFTPINRSYERVTH